MNEMITNEIKNLVAEVKDTKTLMVILEIIKIRIAKEKEENP